MLEPVETKRLTMRDLLSHPWVNKGHLHLQPWDLKSRLDPRDVNDTVVKYMTHKLNYSDSAIREAVINRKANAMTANYNLLLQRLERGLGLPETGASQQAVRNRIVHERQSVFRKFQTDVDAFIEENKENTHNNVSTPESGHVEDASGNGDPDIIINHIPDDVETSLKEEKTPNKDNLHPDKKQGNTGILKRELSGRVQNRTFTSTKTENVNLAETATEDVTDIRDSGFASYTSANVEPKSVKFKMTKPHEAEVKLISVDEAPPLKRDKYNLLPSQYHAGVKENRNYGSRQVRAMAALRHKTKPSPPPPPPNSALGRREYSSASKTIHDGCSSKEPTVLKREDTVLNKTEETFYDKYRFKVPNTEGGRILCVDSGSQGSSGSGIGGRSRTMPSLKMRRLGVVNRTEKPPARGIVFIYCGSF